MTRGFLLQVESVIKNLSDFLQADSFVTGVKVGLRFHNGMIYDHLVGRNPGSR